MQQQQHDEDDGLRDFRVECTGDVREVYLVRARDEQDAMARWMDGECMVQESSSVEPVSAKAEED